MSPHNHYKLVQSINNRLLQLHSLLMPYAPVGAKRTRPDSCTFVHIVPILLSVLEMCNVTDS